MNDVSMIDNWDAIQRAFLPTSAMLAMQQNACAYWSDQDKMLNCMEDFTKRWFDRRHEGTRSALEAARRLCEASTPIDVMREYQTWLTGAFERLLADGVECQRYLMTVSTLLAKPMALSGEEGKTEAKPSQPKPSQRQHQAA